MKPYFIFKGVESTPFLYVEKLPPIVIPDRNAEKINVPGRNGYLTIDDGTYQGFPAPVECAIKDLSQVDFICNWLTGSGDVIFSNRPDIVFKAMIINRTEIAKVAHTFHRFTVIFDCQPFGYDISNNIITLTTAGTILNPGTVPSDPIIKIYGTENITLTINGVNIYLYNVADYVTVDSVLMDAYKDTILKNNDMVGEFPELAPGKNTISWVGTVSKVEIIPNWRYL